MHTRTDTTPSPANEDEDKPSKVFNRTTTTALTMEAQLWEVTEPVYRLQSQLQATKACVQ